MLEKVIKRFTITTRIYSQIFDLNNSSTTKIYESKSCISINSISSIEKLFDLQSTIQRLLFEKSWKVKNNQNARNQLLNESSKHSSIDVVAFIVNTRLSISFNSIRQLF